MLQKTNFSSQIHQKDGDRGCKLVNNGQCFNHMPHFLEEFRKIEIQLVDIPISPRLG
jgi:hypothetical protein